MIAQRFAAGGRGHDDERFVLSRQFDRLRLVREQLFDAEILQRRIQNRRQRPRQFAESRLLRRQIRDVRDLVAIVQAARDVVQKLRGIERRGGRRRKTLRHAQSLSRERETKANLNRVLDSRVGTSAKAWRVAWLRCINTRLRFANELCGAVRLEWELQHRKVRMMKHYANIRSIENRSSSG